MKRTIAKDKKDARANELKEELKKLKGMQKSVGKGRGRGRGKGKGKEDEAVKKLQDAIVEAESHLITGVMNNGTVDILGQYYGRSSQRSEGDDGGLLGCVLPFSLY